MILRISHSLYPVYNLGPGERIALWFQGCSIRCPGCLNPESWDFEGGESVYVLVLFDALIKISESLQGISISGGEPFDQYEALILLCSLIKVHTKLDVLVFSGYTLEQLTQKFADLKFIKVIDYLIAGPYLQAQPAATGLKGSLNQRSYKFIKGKAIPIPDFEVDKRCSLNLDAKNGAYLSGIPREGEIQQLVKSLNEAGIAWT